MNKWKDKTQYLQSLAEEGYSYQAIGDMLNITRERVRQIFKKYNLTHSSEYKRKRKEAAHYQKWGDKSQPEYHEKRHKFYRKKANAIKEGIPFELKFVDIVWPEICPILGIPINYLSVGRTENSCSFDRLDCSKGYTKDNVIVMSWRANRIKNDGSAEEHQKIADFLRKALQ